jgi:gluconokinase
MTVRIVVMGPSGCGKSTVGSALAESIGARFIDADDLHPLTNVEKMAAGIPLDDEDRMPWLRTVGAALRGQDRIVIACSALRRGYRDAIREEAPDTFFVELVVDRATLEARLTQRSEHFMPASLLDSQLETLESLQEGERGIRVSASLTLDEELGRIRDALQAAA